MFWNKKISKITDEELGINVDMGIGTEYDMEMAKEINSERARTTSSTRKSTTTNKGKTTASGTTAQPKTTKTTSQTSTRRGTSTQMAGGVNVSPTNLKNEKKVTIRYQGLLSQCGADAVYVHSGFGSNTWNKVIDVPMAEEKPGTWKATVSIDTTSGPRLNFCFRDRAENWDNNYGNNWYVELNN